VNGKIGFNPIERGGSSGTQMAPRHKGTGAEVYSHGRRRKLSFVLGRYTRIFQAEVHAIKECAVENLVRNYKNKNIYNISDRQAAIKALGKYQITSNWSWTANNPSYNWPNIGCIHNFCDWCCHLYSSCNIAIQQ
jgi:hypothetical protein